jgi:hypothetical protein
MVEGAVIHMRITGVARAATALVVVAVTGVALLGTPAQASQSFLGNQTCTTGTKCRSHSQTSGVAGTFPFHYTVHSHNNVDSVRWPMTSNKTWHSFRYGTGYVEVFIYTTDTLWSQYLECECVTPPCPV